MEIDCWECEFNNFDSAWGLDEDGEWDGEDENWYYDCNHPKADGPCPLDKYVEDDCKLLDE